MRLSPRPRMIPERPLSEIRSAVQDRRIDRDLDRAFPSSEWEDDNEDAPEISFRKRLRSLRRFLATTPGKLILVTVSLLLLTGILGGVAVNAAHDRQEGLERLMLETEQISHASQQLYSSLSLANTAATTQSLTFTEVETVTKQYETAIQNASRAAIAASSAASNLPKEDAELLSRINALIPRYTNLIGQATAESSMRNPMATIHQSEAQRIMQDNLLPAAEQLYLNRYKDITNAQQNWAKPLVSAIVSILVLITVLIVVQFWLNYITRRRFNAGLLATTAMAAISLLWVVVSSTITFTTAEPGAEPLSEILTHARITSQQTRSEEMIALAESNAGSKIDSTQFYRNLDEVDAAFDEYEERSPNKSAGALATQGKNAVKEWRDSHETMVKLLDQGDRRKATDRATSLRKEAAGGQFTNVDSAIQRAISDAREELRNSANLAHSALVTTVAGLGILVVFEALGIIVGMVPRFREYE
ncbi:MAG: hypothetical protein WAN89_06760 [Lawsonella sp.]